MEREKMEIPNMSSKQWADRDKAKMFEWIREYFAYRAVFGDSLMTYNEDFFRQCIKFLEEEIKGGESNERSTKI